ncbi:MAG: hypothetical protein AAF662_02875 [Pseudomonadota bacterium]
MLIEVPRAQSRILNLKLTPELPVDGVSQDWKFTCDSIVKDAHITGLDIVFSSASTRSERLSESLVLRISIDRSVQTSVSIWRFAPQGLYFASNERDYKRCFDLVTTDGGNQLIATVTCLDNEGEDFKFSFLAMNTDLKSGECRIYSSADPEGSVRRRS